MKRRGHMTNVEQCKRLSNKDVHKILRKTNISNLIRALLRAYQGLEILVFWKILATYLMDDP